MSTTKLTLNSPQLGHSGGYDRAVDGGLLLQDSQVTLDLFDVDGLAYENERLWIGVGPRIAVRVVEHSRVRYDLSRGAALGTRNTDLDMLAKCQLIAGGPPLGVLPLGIRPRRHPGRSGRKRARLRIIPTRKAYAVS